jgi:hypothetical protein
VSPHGATSARIEESPDQHAWFFEGQRVTQLCVDVSSCRLQTWSLQASLDIRFGVPFRLTLADGTSREIDPEASEQAAPLLSLINREIVTLVVTRAGALEVRLTDGSILSVDSHPRYEAFEVSGGGALEGLSYLAVPGGGSPWGG